MFGRLIYIWRAIFCSWWVGDDLFRGVVLTLDPLRLLQEAARERESTHHLRERLPGPLLLSAGGVVDVCYPLTRIHLLLSYMYVHSHMRKRSALSQRDIFICVRNATQTAPLQHLTAQCQVANAARRDQNFLMHVQLRISLCCDIRMGVRLSGKIVLMLLFDQNACVFYSLCKM